MPRIIGVCLLLVSLTSFAGTPKAQPLATGNFGPDCNIAPMFGLRLFLPNGSFAHLLAYRDSTWKPPLHEKLEFMADVYPDLEKPRFDQMQASVIFDRFDSEHAEGSYTLTTKDNSPQEGQFKARRSHKRVICM